MFRQTSLWFSTVVNLSPAFYNCALTGRYRPLPARADALGSGIRIESDAGKEFSERQD